MLAKLTAIAVLAASCAAVSGPAAARDIYVRIAPPAPRHEVIPAPRAGYLWTPGYYNYRGGRYVWINGNWARERAGYAYRPHAWVEDGGRWRYNRGGWDRDHDGVPNRFDRQPNNPHRR